MSASIGVRPQSQDNPTERTLTQVNDIVCATRFLSQRALGLTWRSAAETWR